MHVRMALFYALVVLTATLRVNLASAQSNANLPRAHSVAPSFVLPKVNGFPLVGQADLSGLRGKVVVLEFWATWCAPCIGEIPAINRLVASVDPARVKFISITDEEPAKVSAFLKKRPISGTVAIDITGGVFERYGVATRPATVVIDPQGRIVSNNLSPDQLSAGQLSALALGKSQRLSASHERTIDAKVDAATAEALKEQLAAAGVGGSQEALFSLTLSEAKGKDTHAYLTSPDSYELIDADLISLLHFALAYNDDRIEMDTSAIGSRTYNLSLHASDVPEKQIKAAVEMAIASGAKVQFEHHQTEENVLLLQPHPVPPGPDGKVAGFGFFNKDKQEVVLVSASTGQVAGAVEDASLIPVVNEAGSALPCTATIKVGPGGRELLREALEKQCGLTLAEGRRSVDRITVTPMPKSTMN